MNYTYSILPKQKNKHLNYEHYEYIINSVIKFESKHKSQTRNTGKTEFIKKLSKIVGTSVSNIYTIIKDARITVVTSNLEAKVELSASAAFGKRNKSSKRPNNHKFNKSTEFINMVENEILNNPFASVDETINYLILHNPERIKGLSTICTKTFYNYLHAGLLRLKPIDLPRIVRRKTKTSCKNYIPKNQKGTPIAQRPKHVENRKEFGHWEGDLVTGPRDGKKGAYLTLIERKTRFFYMLPIKSKSSKNVYMQINKLNKFYGDDFNTIFKSITFDNGNEFARYKDIEKKPGCKNYRTKVYFARPYHSCDRASNENCNGLIRRVIKKGTNINTISNSKTIEINDRINKKKRKIHNYLPSEKLFLNELKKLNITENTIFYKINS